ncbi:hypothetical protein BDW22DRAFT_1044929 [Trametopsis cervina]|nr:hypothetical protein BDW22DRAFT_1044929 [Trametopsis cervina]
MPLSIRGLLDIAYERSLDLGTLPYISGSSCVIDSTDSRPPPRPVPTAPGHRSPTTYDVSESDGLTTYRPRVYYIPASRPRGSSSTLKLLAVEIPSHGRQNCINHQRIRPPALDICTHAPHGIPHCMMSRIVGVSRQLRCAYVGGFRVVSHALGCRVLLLANATRASYEHRAPEFHCVVFVIIFLLRCAFEDLER